MKKVVSGLLVAGALALAPGLTQAQGPGVEATFGKAYGDWGFELGGTYAIDVGPLTLRPAAGAFVSTEDGRGTSFYAKGEATFTIPAVAELGLGARLQHEKVKAYGLVAFPIMPKLKLTLQGGDRYAAAGMRFAF